MARSVLLEAHGDADLHLKRVGGHALFACADLDETQFLHGLIERSSLDATDQEKLRRFLEVGLGPRYRFALSGDVQRRAAGKVPVALAVDDADQPVCRVHKTHKEKKPANTCILSHK